MDKKEDKEMRIVIEISEELFHTIHNVQNGSIASKTILNAVSNGTPIPKGCGRLIDADELKKEYPHDTDWDYPVNTNCSVVESIDNAETIIEADMESER